jgi:hypothetical protein
MTADKYLAYWLSNRDWWEYDDKGKAVIKPTAPKDAQDSYKYYLERTENEKYRI